MLKARLFASVSLRPLLGLGTGLPPADELPPGAGRDTITAGVAQPLPPRFPTREEIDELVRVSNRQIPLRHLHPRRLREDYED